VYWVTDGIDTCRIGFLPRHMNHVGLHILTPELQEEVKEKSEPSKLLRVSMARYQHPPTISCGRAKWNRGKNGRWTKRPKEMTRQRTQKN
jgi:hypothetical protein